jgi:5'-3' exonuclease
MQQVVRKTIAKANNIETKPKVYHLLVDGNSVLKSSLVNKNVTNSKGEEYGAVLLFLRRIGQLLMKRDFSHCVVCWDGYNSGVLRWKIYNDYKANRGKNYEAASTLSNPENSYDAYIAAYCKKVIDYHNKNKKPVQRNETEDEIFQRQRALLQEILDELFVRQYMYENVEGDDLISYYCKNKGENDYIVIVSEDRDISQLIRDDICVYIPSKKVFVSPKNDKEILGIPSCNIVLNKMICGDASDNIKGVRGMGETTLKKYYPQIVSEKATLEGFLGNCRQVLEERKANKKKPLQCLENALNSVTDGCQGKQLFEINKKIIDLSEPLLTEEAKAELDEIYDAPIDPEGRDIKNVYKIIEANGMSQLSENVNAFGNLFSMYERIKVKEKEFFQQSLKQ